MSEFEGYFLFKCWEEGPTVYVCDSIEEAKCKIHKKEEWVKADEFCVAEGFEMNGHHELDWWDGNVFCIRGKLIDLKEHD